MFVELSNLLVERIQRGIGLSAFAQKNDSFHRIVIVDDSAIFAADGFSELAQTHFGRLHHGCEIAHTNRRSILHLNHRCSDIIRGLHEAHGAYIECLFSALDETAPGICIVGGKRLFHLA